MCVLTALRCAVAATIVCALPATGQETSEPSGARSMFYNPWTGTVAKHRSESPAPSRQEPASTPQREIMVSPDVKFVGIHYWFALEGVGPVADSRTFMTGERLRLHVRSNANGYMAVWAMHGGQRSSLLLPVNGDQSGTAIQAGKEYVSPPMRFQLPAKDEQLLLVFARQRSNLPSFDLALSGASGVIGGAGARDLVVETNESTPGEVGTYVVNRRAGPIVKEITLRHVAR